MVVDGDGTLIAGIPEINLFCQHPLSRVQHQPTPAHRDRSYTRVGMCVCANVKNDVIDDRRRRGFMIDMIPGSFRGSLGRISVILIVQGCPNLLNRCNIVCKFSIFYNIILL